MKEILVLERNALPPAWLPREGSLPMAWADFGAELAAAGRSRWLERSEAEKNPAWKQPIPYVLLRDGNGAVALYRRQGSEKRLHGLWSAGIGGHVEQEDGVDTIGQTLLCCANRELAEEVPGCTAELHFLGIVNEEVTAVGRVHWGVVFEARVERRMKGGVELGKLAWIAPHKALEYPLELWSRLALGLTS